MGAGGGCRFWCGVQACALHLHPALLAQPHLSTPSPCRQGGAAHQGQRDWLRGALRLPRQPGQQCQRVMQLHVAHCQCRCTLHKQPACAPSSVALSQSFRCSTAACSDADGCRSLCCLRPARWPSPRTRASRASQVTSHRPAVTLDAAGQACQTIDRHVGARCGPPCRPDRLVRTLLQRRTQVPRNLAQPGEAGASQSCKACICTRKLSGGNGGMLVPCAAAARRADACAMCKLDFLPCRSQWAPQLCGPLATQPEPR